jgi:hypothetical protein
MTKWRKPNPALNAEGRQCLAAQRQGRLKMAALHGKPQWPTLQIAPNQLAQLLRISTEQSLS